MKKKQKKDKIAKFLGELMAYTFALLLTVIMLSLSALLVYGIIKLFT